MFSVNDFDWRDLAFSDFTNWIRFDLISIRFQKDFVQKIRLAVSSRIVGILSSA